MYTVHTADTCLNYRFYLSIKYLSHGFLSPCMKLRRTLLTLCAIIQLNRSMLEEEYYIVISSLQSSCSRLKSIFLDRT